MPALLTSRPVALTQTCRLTECRSCASSHLTTFLDLGSQPIANALLETGQLTEVEPRFPLELAFCHDCALVQVTKTIPADVLFGRDYPYYSSYSEALLEHSRAHVRALLAERRLDSSSFVVEIASNDGYLLHNFIAAGVPALGIDPAAGPVAAAQKRGVPTVQAFFSADFARRLVASGYRADVIVANNVAAHVDRINDFIEGLAILLKDHGLARIEVAYVRDMIEKCEFDTIYHEHLFYWSITAVTRLLSRHGLHLNDAERLAIHGGSIRLSVSKAPGRSMRLAALLAEEEELGFGDIAHYRTFAERVNELRNELRASIRQIRGDGKRLAAYGAAAKGATLLNSIDLDAGTIEYVVDRNPAKVGKYLPGVRVPIRPVDTLVRDKPDFVLVLAWNFAVEIIRENENYARQGGRFIVPAVNRPSL